MMPENGKEGDRLGVEIACLDRDTLQATLISSAGSHCEVWRTSRRQQESGGPLTYLEFVLKHPVGSHSRAEIASLARHHLMLKTALGEIIPEAIFFITEIDGQANVCVIASAINVWFNIANPQNREEAIGLLKAHASARDQLQHFVTVARAWRHSDDPRLIDLFGVDNLVMDNDRNIRYLDSFFVFFFEDLLELLDEPDEELEGRIKISLGRLAYLEEILEASKP